jgi:hypothetical protein
MNVARHSLLGRPGVGPALAFLSALSIVGELASADVDPSGHFGQGCTGASGVAPELTLPDFGVAGELFTAEVVCGPDLPGLLFVGLQTDTWLGFDLPLDLAIFDATGCDLLVSPAVQLPFTTGGDGVATLEFAGFDAGQTIYFQALVYDTDLEDFDPLIATSDGVEFSTVAASGIQVGDLVITEIMKNPSFVPDAKGEWIELYNALETPVDLNGWCLVDDTGQVVVLSADAPLEVPGFGYAVVGNNGDEQTNGGITMLHDWSNDGTFTLSNSSDAVRIVTPDGIVVDEVQYLSADGWLNPVGASLELAEGILDWDVNDDGSVWEIASCFIGGESAFNTDLGSPGAPTGSCPYPELPTASGDVIFSEVMQNPSAVSDANGEWFEIYNTTATEIDLDGFTITLAGGSFTVVGPLLLPSGGFQAFARVGDPALNGGLPPTVYDYPDGLALSNGSQGMRIKHPDGSTACFIEYDNGLTYPDPSGASMSLDPTQLTLEGAVDGAAWCVSSTSYGAGDDGTPGAPNDVCGG